MNLALSPSRLAAAPLADLSIEGLTVRAGGRAILDGVSLAFRAGELAALVGPNGAGKTTLLRAALGLVAPESGTVRLGGQDVRRLPRAALARRVAWLPQGGETAWPLTGREIVALGRLPFRGDSASADDARAIDRALDRAGARPFADRPVSTLSGGERALVLLARALAVEAPVLLVDEPAAALDPTHQLRVMEALAEEARAGRAVVAVLHDLALAQRFCGRVVAMAQGRIAADGPPDAALTAGLVSRIYGVAARRFEADGGASLILPWTLGPAA